MSDKNDDPEDKSIIQRFIDRYFPPAIVANKLKDQLSPPKKKETEAERKARLAQQALLGVGARKK